MTSFRFRTCIRPDGSTPGQPSARTAGGVGVQCQVIGSAAVSSRVISTPLHGYATMHVHTPSGYAQLSVRSLGGVQRWPAGIAA